MSEIIPVIAIWALPVLLAITLHEAAHGYAARHFGDPTAYVLGRITLNPIKHIDPVGTVLVPGLIVLLGAVSGAMIPLFGWAKPVPVNFGGLRNPKRDMLWVAAAGPGANLFLAIMWAVLLKLAVALPENAYTLPLMKMADAGIQVNASLMLLNLLPIPPLDGGRMVVSLLPHKLSWKFAQIEPYGFFILLVLLYTKILDVVLWPLMAFFRFGLAVLFGF